MRQRLGLRTFLPTCVHGLSLCLELVAGCLDVLKEIDNLMFDDPIAFPDGYKYK